MPIVFGGTSEAPKYVSKERQMPQEFFGATIHVMWPKGKTLGVYQVLACDEDQTLYRLQVTGVDAHGQDIKPPRRKLGSKKAERK